MTATLIRSDATTMPLSSESVDLVVTSPPYFALRSYTDGGEHYGGQLGSEPTPVDFLLALWSVLDECWRVLKPGGSCWVNLGDKYGGSGGNNNSNLGERASLRGPSTYSKASDVRAKSLMGLPWRFALGAICPDLYRAPLEPHRADPDYPDDVMARGFPQWVGRAEIIWSKPNGLPESVTDRVRRSHEQWFHLTKNGRYYAAVDRVREPHTHKANGSTFGGKKSIDSTEIVGSPERRTGMNTYDTLNPLGKLPGSVWTIATEPLKVPEWLDVDHFAAFPQEWPRRIIEGWSPAGICTACGEGRRPTVEKEAGEKERDVPAYGAGRHGTGGSTLGSRGPSASVTGESCSCPDTSAPTRPAIVLDPFAGTGTTVMVARTLGRYGVGLDLSADYLRLAQWRVFDSGHGAKSRERSNREKQGALL